MPVPVSCVSSASQRLCPSPPSWPLTTRPKFLCSSSFLLCGACLWSWWCGTWTVRTLTLHAGQSFSLSSFHSVACVCVCPDKRKEETETRPWPFKFLFFLSLVIGATDVSCFPFLSLPHFYFIFWHPPHYVSLSFTNMCAVDVIQKIKRWGRVFFFFLVRHAAQFLVSPFIWILGGADKRKKKIKSRWPLRRRQAGL